MCLALIHRPTIHFKKKSDKVISDFCFWDVMINFIYTVFIIVSIASSAAKKQMQQKAFSRRPFVPPLVLEACDLLCDRGVFEITNLSSSPKSPRSWQLFSETIHAFYCCEMTARHSRSEGLIHKHVWVWMGGSVHTHTHTHTHLRLTHLHGSSISISSAVPERHPSLWQFISC